MNYLRNGQKPIKKDNNGAEHRRQLFGKNKTKKIGSGTQFYYWLKKNNYPKDYQILCLNCNCTKSLNKGELPLERKGKYEKEI